MSFRLIDHGWDRELDAALSEGVDSLRVVVPFIKARAAARLLRHGRPAKLEVITRFHLGDFSQGVSDMSALRMLMEAGARIRGVKYLHAKLYLFGDRRVIVTSANLTEAALTRNHEFGFLAEEPKIVASCGNYFDLMWERAGDDLTLARLDGWNAIVKAHQMQGGQSWDAETLPDEGTDAGPLAGPPLPVELADEDTRQVFVKFFGTSHSRVDPGMTVMEELRDSGSHWACNYPRNKRPRQVRDGDVIFMSRMVQGNDIMIYGRAIAMRHVPGRDDATAEDIERRDWKTDWPHYIRVHHGEYVAGTLANGVSLNQLMNELGVNSFDSTLRRTQGGESANDVIPQNAYRQKASVKLSTQGFAWLNDRLDAAFKLHGRLSKAEMETLDWPALAAGHLEAFREWLHTSAGLKENTAREYVYFLKRCMAHYSEEINPTTVPNEEASNLMLERVRRVVAERGRWAEGTFNERDVSQNLGPALRAYGRFSLGPKSETSPS